MASINVNIFDHEKSAMLKAIRLNKGKVSSVAKLAKQAGINPNRGRFVIEELVQEGKVRKIASKAFNEKYIRYIYEEVK